MDFQPAEQLVTLRLPENLAEKVRERMQSSSMDDVYVTLPQGTDRLCQFAIGTEAYHATLVDLPTCVEAVKTLDNNAYYKAGEIGQMILVSDKRISDDVPEVDPKLPSGLTKATHSITRRHFRPDTLAIGGDMIDIELDNELARLNDSGAHDEFVRLELIEEDIPDDEMPDDDDAYMDDVPGASPRWQQQQQQQQQQPGTPGTPGGGSRTPIIKLSAPSRPTPSLKISLGGARVAQGSSTPTGASQQSIHAAAPSAASPSLTTPPASAASASAPPPQPGDGSMPRVSLKIKLPTRMPAATVGDESSSEYSYDSTSGDDDDDDGGGDDSAPGTSSTPRLA